MPSGLRSLVGGQERPKVGTTKAATVNALAALKTTASAMRYTHAQYVDKTMGSFWGVGELLVRTCYACISCCNLQVMLSCVCIGQHQVYLQLQVCWL